MSWLTSSWSELAVVAARAALMYGTALVALRLAQRRTLAQWTIIDFAAAVASGAIIGRTAVADSQSYATGAVALLTIVAAHRLASLLRFQPLLGKLIDYRVRVLVADGQVRRGQLRRCGLTDNDLYAELRQRGVFDVRQLQYVLYEGKGGLTVVPRQTPPPVPLVADGLRDSTGYAPPGGSSSTGVTP
ncbi:Uncharacterized membrane protein YcaP, DUF421 family [Modestobacter sp. DSM 44400]|uniref:DUF421 domain-containing protein n=1 Tax=Modestobacter sp. DSM 44400 TaxID=1550230 RepID=UPI00089657A8|nr:YetF domain-containing protein [Modestobacter sp. DSM 44400]SDY72135.1 Uncharacterized membrane protein YcaP, DUF421 family [Modestobacter sp. DSM 44400]